MLPKLLVSDKKMSEALIGDEQKGKEIFVQQAEQINSISISHIKSTLSTVYAMTVCAMIILWMFIFWAAVSNDMSTESTLNELRELDTLDRELDELERSQKLLNASYSDLENELTKLQQQLEHTRQVLKTSGQCSNVPKELRFDCHPEDGASESSCGDRGCCWNPIVKTPLERATKVPLNTPYCYYPKNWRIYRYLNYTKIDNDFSGFIGLMENYKASAYKKDIKMIRMEAAGVDQSIIRVKIFDAANKRYEPFWPLRDDPQPCKNVVKNAKYKFDVSHTLPGFRVTRATDRTTVFDSIGNGGFIFADQMLQISTLLPTSNIYGLGEHRTPLRLNTNWQSFTMFNKDQPPTENANLYGSQPFYLVIEKSGNCHGVLFLNSNAMDVILQPTPALTFRSIGGVFDMYILMGPTPADVVRQYSEIVGKPFMPPYWSLGFHLCRFGYKTLEDTKKVWNRTRAAGIPFDTQWNDLDYMDNNNDFTYDKDKFKGLPDFLHEIKEAGMHYIPLIDAGISASEANGSYRPFDEGIRRGIFIKEANSDSPFKGKVWNRKSTVWPDFTNPDTREYWRDMMSDMWHMFPYDGAWIDMNEPSNFYNGHIDGCVQNELDDPPYLPNVVGNLLATKTVCMNARHHLGSHYDVHNTLGMSEAVMTNYALTRIRRKRPFVISRSTWIGHGSYAGHWSGDIYSSWYDMKMTIPQLLSYSLFQIPMMGADICGFNGNTTQALCNRWMQLGAFYPFSRNHNTDDGIEQDPVALGELVVKSSRKALMIRYRFLPYLYTLFFRAHLYGETVARPLFFEFVNDPNTYAVDTQFLWGGSLMILPVLQEGATKVTAYVPQGVWYDFYDKKAIVSNGQNFTFDAPLDTIPLLIRGGSILPAQTAGNTTTASRMNNFELLIAPDLNGSATGELFLDNSDDNLDPTDPDNHRWWKFILKKQTLFHEEVRPGKYSEGNMTLGKVQVMGVVKNVTQVLINGDRIEFQLDTKRSYLTVKDLKIDLRNRLVLSWK